MDKDADGRVRKLGVLSGTALKAYTFSGDRGTFAEPLGVGGSSVVYRVDQELDAERGISIPRALKLFVMREDLVDSGADSSFLPAEANFLEEVSNISQLSHENLVQVTDAGEEDFDVGGEMRRIPYLVTHLINGCTLRDVMDGSPTGEFARLILQKRPEVAVQLIQQMAAGLTYLHSRGFLHCDIAPKNIFIENAPQLRAIVGDVGMSRQTFGPADDGIFVAGTRSYSPPDIAEYFGQTVPRKTLCSWLPSWDIYGFAKTAKELLAYVLSLSARPWLLAATEKATKSFEQYLSAERLSSVVEQIEYCLPIHRERGGIPELEPNALMTRKRMMPIEGLSFTKRIDRLVRHPAVVRLQGVPQLTIVKSASPGGNHSRYEHALGVMENVRRMLSALLDESSFLGVLGKDSITTGLLVGLLYNGSRFPFSNVIHELNKRRSPGQSKLFASFDRAGLFSEVLGEKFVAHNGMTLEDQIRADFPSVDITKLRRILTAGSVSELRDPDEAVLHALLNSSLDARVIDFVRRDSLHLGLSSGDFFELDDLLPHLVIAPARSGGASQISLRSSGVSVAEQIILMRYWLYQRVYWNLPNRAFNATVRRSLLDLLKVPNFESELRANALYMDERETLKFLHQFAREHGLTSATALLGYVVGYEKTLYREVFVRNLRHCDAEPLVQDRADLETLVSSGMSYSTMFDFEDRLGQWLRDRVQVPDGGAPPILLDVPFEPGNIKLGADIFVAVHSRHGNEAGELKTLEKVSPVIEGVNKNFSNDLQRLRILVRPDIDLDKEVGWQLYEHLRGLLN